MKRLLVTCTTDSMIWNFLVPHIKNLEDKGVYVECACSETGFYFKLLSEIHNLKINKISFKRSPFRFSNTQALIQLISLVKKKKFDAIFCHEPVGGAIGRIVGKLCGCKVIYMAHGFHFFKGAPKNRAIYYLAEKALSYLTDVLITINKEDYNASLSFHAKKVCKVNGIGVDTERFQGKPQYRDYIKREYGLPDESIIALSVGELIARKNHSSVIDAMSLIKNKNVYYFIVGDGELKQELEKKIDKLSLGKKVYLIGYRSDINELCNSADMFILPSIHEGLSVALMESMACGKPVIASKIRGNVDLVDKEGGYLIPTFDIHGYARAIDSLAGSVNKRLKFGDYNKEKIKEFDIKRIKRDLLRILMEEN